MKFEYEGGQYRIEFQREHRDVETHQGGVTQKTRSLYPYTRAKLYLLPVGSIPLLIAEGEAGCLPTDKFTKEKGRLWALRALTYKLNKQRRSKEFKQALWDAYTNRPRVAGERKTAKVTVLKSELPALPPASTADNITVH